MLFISPQPFPLQSRTKRKIFLIFVPIKLSEIYGAGRVKSSLNYCLKFLVISKRRLDQKDVKFKIYDVTTWLTNNYKTHITQYLTKQRQPDNEFGHVIEYNKINIFLRKTCRQSGRETSSRRLFCFLKKALHEVHFDSPQLSIQ